MTSSHEGRPPYGYGAPELLAKVRVRVRLSSVPEKDPWLIADRPPVSPSKLQFASGPGKARRVAQERRIPKWYGSCEELLRDEDVDAGCYAVYACRFVLGGNYCALPASPTTPAATVSTRRSPASSDAVVLIDEAYLLLHSRDSMSRAGRSIGQGYRLHLLGQLHPLP